MPDPLQTVELAEADVSEREPSGIAHDPYRINWYLSREPGRRSVSQGEREGGRIGIFPFVNAL